MKKTSLIVQIVMFAAIALLYVLHFTGRTSSPKAHLKQQKDSLGVHYEYAGSLAYINIDTLLTHYEYFNELREKLLDVQERKGTELQNKFRQWEREASNLEDQRQKLLITRKTYEDNSQRLLAERENLMRLQESASMELMEEEQVMNRQILYKILDYLKEYNEDQGYQYIFSNTLGGNILLADESQDITSEVLEGLNKRYLEEKKKK